MGSANEIVLFDLPSQGKPICWSPNPWKARAALNFKGLPYRTEWTEYTELAPKFSAAGVPPNAPDANPAPYSSPAIRMPDGTYVMDSLKIAHALEHYAPTPSLHLDSGLVQPAQTAVLTMMKFLGPVLLPRAAAELVNTPSQEHFYTTREKRMGMPLPDLAESEKGGENAWKAAGEGFEQIKELLGKDESGPYVMGQTPSHADLIIAGFWQFCKRLDHGGDVYDRAMKVDESFPTHYAACEKWLERDDH